MRKTLFALVLSILPLPAVAQVYADFQTSLGNFTCQLNYGETPKTVANFITLAEGSRPWLDETTGSVSTIRPAKPFYDGLTFHRVVNNPGFRIVQGGSRAGDGSDGPGYNFPDEYKPGVPVSYKFDQPYLLAMANSGLNTNGAQFFITGSAIPELEGKHTVFGKVISGQDVVESILGVTTTSTDDNPDNNTIDHKPITPVVIQHVAIRRVGKDATRFVATRVLLPKVTAPRFRTNTLPAPDPNAYVIVSFNQAAKTTARLFYSADSGATWNFSGGRYMGPGERMLASMRASIPSAKISYSLQHRVAVAAYPTDLFTPSSYLNTQFFAENESGSYLLRFNPNGVYDYLIVLPSGEQKEGKFTDNFFYPTYSAEGYSGVLLVTLGSEGSFRFNLGANAKSRAGVTSGVQRSYMYSDTYHSETGEYWMPLEDNSDFSWSPLPKVK